jgi:hypothetical protein
MQIVIVCAAKERQNLDARLMFSTLNLDRFTGGRLSNSLFTKLLIQLSLQNRSGKLPKTFIY